jgi:type IV pilus assembly protein PilQ
LGGLTTEEDDVTINGVPFFSRIPLLNFFFKDESKTKNKEDLIIFITPTIINGETKGDTDAQRIPG